MLTFRGTAVNDGFWTGQGPFEDPLQQSPLYGENTQSGPGSALCARWVCKFRVRLAVGRSEGGMGSRTLRVQLPDGGPISEELGLEGNLGAVVRAF